jgi:hypothetical protein
LLIDLEEDKAARVVVFGLLAEMDRKGPAGPILSCGDTLRQPFYSSMT